MKKLMPVILSLTVLLIGSALLHGCGKDTGNGVGGNVIIKGASK